MAQTGTPSRRDTTWYVLACTGLVAVTVVAAVLMYPFTYEFADDLWFDPQSDSQRLEAWRIAAVMTLTSGGEVGFCCAVVAGLLSARWSRPRPRRTGLLAAVAAGAGLALADLAAAYWVAAPRLRERAENAIGDSGGPFLDPDLWSYGAVRVAIAVFFVALVIAAATGFGLALVKPPALKVVSVVLALALSVVGAPAGHLVVTLAVSKYVA